MNSIIPALASATGNLDILEEFYSDLASKFGIGNSNSVRYISEISNGLNDGIYQLSTKKSQNFYVDVPDLVDALTYITYTGKRIRNDKSQNYE